MKLKYKLTLYIAPFFIMLITILSFWGSHSMIDGLKQNSRQEAIKQTRNIAWLIKKAVVNSGVSGRGINQSVHLIDNFIQDGEQLYLFKSGGELFHRTTSSGLEHLEISYEKSGGELTSQFIRYGDQLFLKTSMDFEILSRPLTLVRLVDTSHLDIIYKDYVIKSTFIYIGLFLLGFFSLFLMIRQLSKPIQDLFVEIENVKCARPRTSVVLKGVTEFDDLASAFNELMLMLEERHAKVEYERDIRQNFIDTLRHEMRTPLTSIIGYSDLMRRDVLSREDIITSSQSIYAEARRLCQMSDALLYGLMANGEIELENISTKCLVNDLVSSYKHKLRDKNLHVKSTIKIEHLKANKILLFQAIGNLMDNAIKASCRNGEILMNIHEKGIELIDYGCGLKKTSADQKEYAEGFGFGLHIVREIASAHGWIVKIENHDSRGVRAQILFNES